MSSEPTVFLVDDDAGVREALAWLVESVDLRVETFASAAAFLESYDSNRPGCLVLDVRMPGMSGLDLLKTLRDEGAILPVIIVTGHGDVPLCIRAYDGGAFAFVEKPVNHQALLDHIHRAIEKDAQARQCQWEDPDVEARRKRLTPREREVMELLIVGKSMKQIAATLGISVQTGSKHRTQVLEKMGVENDVELVRRILESKGQTW
jgi:FixJ family two-component response regulator